jgi:hypothetical protein
MARDAVGRCSWNVARRFGLSTAGPLAGIGTVVAAVAAAGADGRVVHRVGREAWRGVDVAVALDSRYRDVRRRGIARRRHTIVAA